MLLIGSWHRIAHMGMFLLVKECGCSVWSIESGAGMRYFVDLCTWNTSFEFRVEYETNDSYEMYLNITFVLVQVVCY